MAARRHRIERTMAPDRDERAEKGDVSACRRREADAEQGRGGECEGDRREERVRRPAVSERGAVRDAERHPDDVDIRKKAERREETDTRPRSGAPPSAA